MDKNELPGIVINVDEAVVRTATIEIRMLTIDRRKVTLSLFRQFKQRNLLDPATGNQRGVPWGLINYFWPGCDERGREERHLHVLWQDGQELYRDCVYRDDRGIFGDLKWKAGKHLNCAWQMARLALHTAPDGFELKPLPDGRYEVRRKDEGKTWTFSKKTEVDIHGYRHDVRLIDQLEFYWGARRYVPSFDPDDRFTSKNILRRALAEHYKNIEQFSAQELWDKSFKLADQGEALDAQANTLAEQWDREYQALEQLDQLFIAG